MKYKVGDKVKIREDLDIDKMYDGWDCSEEMAKCGGMIATIVKCCGDSYKIDVEDNFYNWTDGMLEDYTEDTEKEAEVYKTVDVGFYLDYCGHRVLEDVWQGGIANHGHVFFNTKKDENQYILPTDAIDWIIPHED